MDIDKLENRLNHYKQQIEDIKEKYPEYISPIFSHVTSSNKNYLRDALKNIRRKGMHKWPQKKESIRNSFRILRFYLREFDENESFRIGEKNNIEDDSYIGYFKNSAIVDEKKQYFQALKQLYQSRTNS